MPVGEVYEFGQFVLDIGERRLSAADRVLCLPPKTFDVLVVLVGRAGHAVSKRELLDLVWRDTHVEEGILAVHISGLRKVLGDQRSGAYIETVPRVGYRFTATVGRRPTPDLLSMRWPIGVLPAHPAVHELIGRGRVHLLANSTSEIPKAVAAFQSAIDVDPSYAAAHAGLALACCAQAELRLIPHAVAYDRARTAAMRALAMDSACADAQVALGVVLFLSDWNWIAAQRCLERALEIDPDHCDAYLFYGRLLETVGDLEKGLAAKQKALERNPHSARVHLQIALSYWHQRRYDDVIDWANRALVIDARHLLAREYVAAAYLMKGDNDRHLAESLAHAESHGVPVATLEDIKQVYAVKGRRGLVAYSIEHAIARGGPALQLAMLYGELGDFDEAFRHLDRAIDDHDPCLVDLAVAPQWDHLREDPRMSERLARMGLPVLDRSAFVTNPT